jgi:zinc transport system substrate-binding protein
MSIRNAITIAGTMYTALSEIDPEGETVYRKNLDQLKEDLTALDQELSRILQPLEGKKLFVFHPAFGYFADDYGLEQIAVETGGNEPSARQLAAVIDEAIEHDARVIFVQPQFSQKSAQAVAEEIGGAVVPIDALAGDYIGNMKRIAEAVEEALK